MKMFTLTNIALTLIGLGSVGGILLVVAQGKSSAQDKSEIIGTTLSENERLIGDLTEIKTERTNLKKELAERDVKLTAQNKTISGQTDKIIKLNEQLNEKSEYLNNFLSGGDAFPRLLARWTAGADGLVHSYRFIYGNKSKKWPLYDLKAEIYDYNLIAKNQFKSPVHKGFMISQANIDAARVGVLRVPLVPKNTETPINGEHYDTEGLFWAFLTTRNTANYERMALLTKDGVIYFGFQVYDGDEKLVEEVIEAPPEIKKQLQARLATVPIKQNFIVGQ